MGQSIIASGGVPAPVGGFFVCDFPWAVPKDDMASMEHPLFTLAARPDRRILRYAHGAATIEVTPSVKGLATIHDKDVLIFCVSQLVAALNAGRPVALGAGMVAAWAHYWALIGRGEITPPEVPDDVHAAEMTAAALDPDPEAFVRIALLFGDLAERRTFVDAYLAARRSLVERGVHATLDDLLA